MRGYQLKELLSEARKNADLGAYRDQIAHHEESAKHHDKKAGGYHTSMAEKRKGDENVDCSDDSQKAEHHSKRASHHRSVVYALRDLISHHGQNGYKTEATPGQ